MAEVDSDADILLSRYSDLEFMEDVTNYKCGRCEKVMINKHYNSNCGHHFCFNCKKILDDGGPVTKCPVCNQFITRVKNEDVNLTQKINVVRVRCPNNKHGCPFISSLITMPEHLKTCRMTKDTHPIINKLTTTMETVLDEIGKINKKIDTLNEGMNVVSDMVIQLDKVDDQNKNDVEMAVDDLKQKIQGLQSELHATTGRMQYDIKPIQGFETTKTEDSGTTKIILQLLDQKEDKFYQKLSQAKTEIDNAIVTERASRIDECKKQSAELNLIGGRLDKVAQQMTTQEHTHNSNDNQFKVDIYEIKAELEKTKSKQKVQLATINHCNELMSQFKFNEDEMNSKIKQSQARIYELEKNWKKMENDITQNEKIDFHKAQELVSNQEGLESQSLVYSWTIKGIKENMKKKRFECESDMFPLKGYDFEAKIKFNMYETGYVKMSLCFVNGHNTNRIIQFKVRPEVTYIIRDQVNNREGIITTIDMDYSESFEYGKYCNKSMCSTTIMHSPYVINDTMVIDIYVEPPLIAKQMHPTNGVVTYYINNYNMNKSFEKKGIVYSQPRPYFYTSPNGYRVKAWIYLNGVDDFKGKGLTVYIKFFSVEFNSALPKTIKHKTTIIIFNQSDTNKHLIKSVEQGNNKNDYNIDIAHHSEIENGGFLLNDTLIYRVEIRESI